MPSKNKFLRLSKAARLRGLLAAGSLAAASLAGGSEACARESVSYPGYYRQDIPGYYPYPAIRRSEPRRYRRPSARPEKQKEAAPPPPGPHHLIVSVKSQRVTLYSNGKAVAHSPVSTGTASHPTPLGVFSVIQKNRHHRSNIYSGAPMPYMQRLTWSGIALHQGVLPGYPASHGCIRLPEKFASFLWRTTRLGARVIVSREDVEPYDIVHARLFQPKSELPAAESPPELRKTLDTTQSPVRTAGVATVATDTDGRNPEREPAEAAGETSSLPRQADIPDAILASFAQSLQAKQKKAPPAGPVSIFISRKEKRLFVRQGFHSLFSAPLTFRDENGIFGTHVFTALEKDGKDLRWIAITMPAELPKAEKAKAGSRNARSRRGEPPAKAQPRPVEPVPPAASVLDRIDIPQDVVERVSEYITAGATLIVSDHGLGYETGLYTDFIVVTR